VDTTLQAGVEPALATTTGEDLGLNHELVRACRSKGQWSSPSDTGFCDEPKFFATSKASSGVLAATLFGVGMPYCRWYGENARTQGAEQD
jgi:hypothetical protein